MRSGVMLSFCVRVLANATEFCTYSFSCHLAHRCHPSPSPCNVLLLVKSNFQFLTAYIELSTEYCPHASPVWKLLRKLSCWGIWLGWLRPIQFCREVSKKKCSCQRHISWRFHFLIMKSPSTSVTTCTVSFWYFSKTCTITGGNSFATCLSHVMR